MKKIYKNIQFLIKFIIVIILEIIISVFIFELCLSQGGLIWKNIYRFIHQKDNNFYVYVIGESTSYGAPYNPKISFPKIISYLFDGKINNKKIEIINLAVSGSNVESQYWQLYKNLLMHPKPDAVLLIYAGINDTIGRGYDPNFRRWSLIQKSTILSRAQYLLEGRTSNEFLLNFFGLNKSIEKFKSRLNKIILLAKKYNLKIVISTLVGNISEFSPQDDTIWRSKEISELFNSAKEYEGRGEFKIAIETYENLLRDPLVYPIRIYYHLGKCYEGIFNYEKAKEFYWKAIDMAGSVRPTRYQNKIINDLAKENNIGLADTLKTFEDRSPHGLLGYNLLIDGHHPNLEGYLLLAEGFAIEMEKISGQKIMKHSTTAEEIIKNLDFTLEDMSNVYILSAKWLCLESLMIYDTDDIEDRLAKAEYYLGKARETKETAEICLWNFVIAVLKKDKEKALYWLERGKLLSENSFVFLKHKGEWSPEEWMLLSEKRLLFENVLPVDVLSRIRTLMKE